MIKENDIVKQYEPLTKKFMVNIRKTPEFREGYQWHFGHSKTGTKVVLWTQLGLDTLLELKGLKSPPKQSEPTFKEKSINHVYGIVKQKFKNQHLVLCEIRGVKEMVKVKDSSAIRINSIIPAEKKSDGWVSVFTTDAKGRIHG